MSHSLLPIQSRIHTNWWQLIKNNYNPQASPVGDLNMQIFRKGFLLLFLDEFFKQRFHFHWKKKNFHLLLFFHFFLRFAYKKISFLPSFAIVIIIILCLQNNNKFMEKKRWNFCVLEEIFGVHPFCVFFKDLYINSKY